MGALESFHPRHEVLCQVARWAGPVIARGRGLTFSDFPLSLVEEKALIAREYLAVVDIVERGLSWDTVKASFEMVDSQLYLDSIDYRDGHLSRTELSVRVHTYLEKVSEMEDTLSVLGTRTGYEEMILYCLGRIKHQLQRFMHQSSERRRRS